MLRIAIIDGTRGSNKQPLKHHTKTSMILEELTFI